MSTYTVEALLKAKDSGFSSAFKNAEKSVTGLTSTAEKVGSVFKSVLGANLVSNALIGGVQTLKNAILDVGSAALSEGAKLEQSFGGIDTLYRGAEKEAKQFAATAYRAGISANTYAEQAVSFGASLKQALGGDAVAAANAADKAIMAMADNSAKMGTDIGVVQQTYQSLARGNFAMLDNLKLGFGGTKAEMERLLKTAEDLTGKKYDISNFADITEAIDEVQKSLGIAGVAAREAEETLSGSLNAMKASFQNVLGAITGTELDIKPALQGLATTTSNFLFGNFIPMVGRVMQNLPGAISTFIEAARPALEQGLSKVFSPDVVEKALKVFDNMVSFGSKIKTFFSNFADTGALSSLKTALGDIGTAIGNIFTAITGSAALSGFKGDWTDLGTTIGNVVKAISEAASKIADFVAKMDPAQLRSWMATIGAVVGGFKLFSAVTGSSPVGGILDKLGEKFTIFGNKGKAGTEQAGSGTGLLGQLFQGMGTLITSVADGISTVLQGLGTALSTVAQGFGQAASMANPAQWLSMGAAMLMVGAGVALASAGIALLVDAAIRLGEAGASAGIALTGLVVSIGALAGVFALLGPALTAGAVGIGVFGAAVLMIGAGIAVASAGLSMLAGHLPTIAAHGASAAVGIAALGAGMLVMGAGALVAGAGLVVAGAGLAVVGAGALVAAAGATALGAGLLIVAAGVAAFGLALNLAKPGLTAFANAITKVVNAISGGLVAILNSISGVIQSVGQAALNAGKGFNQLATGVVKITNTNLGDMAASLGTVAVGLGKIAGHASGMTSLGTAMTQVASSLTVFATGSVTAVAAMTAFGLAVVTLQSGLGQLSPVMTAVASGFGAFADQVVASGASLSAIIGPLTALRSQVMALAPAVATASGSLTAFGAKVAVVVGALTVLGAGLAQVRSGSMSVSTAFGQVGASAAGASGQLRAMASTTQVVITAFNNMRTQVQAAMTATLNVLKSVGNQMKAEGTQIGRQTSQNLANGLKSGVGQVTAAMQALSNAAKAVGMATVGVMRSVGAMIGQGLAQGMMSALGAVTAAANALVEQAERAAKAKAQIHSPSRLFRDNIGIYIGQGVAVGIDRSQQFVDKAMNRMFDGIDNFNMQVNDLMGNNLAYSFEAGRSSHVIEVTYQRQDDEQFEVVKEALSAIKDLVSRDLVLNVNGREIARATGDDMSSYQSRQQAIQNRLKGLI